MINYIPPGYIILAEAPIYLIDEKYHLSDDEISLLGLPHGNFTYYYNLKKPLSDIGITPLSGPSNAQINIYSTICKSYRGDRSKLVAKAAKFERLILEAQKTIRYAGAAGELSTLMLVEGEEIPLATKFYKMNDFNNHFSNMHKSSSSKFRSTSQGKRILIKKQDLDKLNSIKLKPINKASLSSEKKLSTLGELKSSHRKVIEAAVKVCDEWRKGELKLEIRSAGMGKQLNQSDVVRNIVKGRRFQISFKKETIRGVLSTHKHLWDPYHHD